MTTFDRLASIRPHKVGNGIIARAVAGDRMTLAVVELEPGAVLPEHHHENEQLGFVVKGVITMRIGGEQRELHPGETYAIPSDMPHDAKAGPDGCTVADVFAPVRADWANLQRKDPSEPNWP